LNRVVIILVLVGLSSILIFLFGNFATTEQNIDASSSLFLQANLAIGSPPAHFTIQKSIDLAKGYIDSLYKNNYPEEVDAPNQARVAEYPSVPLSIKLPDGSVIHSGEDRMLSSILSPIASIFIPITSISNVYSDKYDTCYDITFRKQGSLFTIDDFPILHVKINDNYWTGSKYGTIITVSQKSFQNVQNSNPYVDVYLGTRYLGQATPNKDGHVLGTYVSTTNNDSVFRSIRYTERHSTQLGYEWYLANGNYSKATELSNELVYEGYQLHKDLYTPLFGTDKSLADNYQYQSGLNGVYSDCYKKSSTSTSDSYQYHSKVCTVGVDFYIWISKNKDWLAQTLWAIHLLNKYGSPDTQYYDGNTWWSPREVARFLETKWINNVGIQSPYDATLASSVRTAAFGVLETILGYHYGDAVSRTFADISTRALQLAQAKGEGIIFQYDVKTGRTNDT
jgi:hypothetical protein